jgi:DNA-binding IclR family transcriptional regulator
MPGLTLTLQQAARLFGIEQARCERVLEALVDEGFLTSDGRRFGRADAGRGCA